MIPLIKKYMAMYIGQKLELDETRFIDSTTNKIYTLDAVSARRSWFYIEEMQTWYPIELNKDGKPLDKLLLIPKNNMPAEVKKQIQERELFSEKVAREKDGLWTPEAVRVAIDLGVDVFGLIKIGWAKSSIG